MTCWYLIKQILSANGHFIHLRDLRFSVLFVNIYEMEALVCHAFKSVMLNFWLSERRYNNILGNGKFNLSFLS